MKNRKDNIRENWWDFILKFFMDFVENGLIFLRDFFGIFFWIRGVLKFWTKNLAGNSRTQ